MLGAAPGSVAERWGEGCLLRAQQRLTPAANAEREHMLANERMHAAPSSAASKRLGADSPRVHDVDVPLLVVR